MCKEWQIVYASSFLPTYWFRAFTFPYKNVVFRRDVYDYECNVRYYTISSKTAFHITRRWTTTHCALTCTPIIYRRTWLRLLYWWTQQLWCLTDGQPRKHIPSSSGGYHFPPVTHPRHGGLEDKRCPAEYYGQYGFAARRGISEERRAATPNKR